MPPQVENAKKWIMRAALDGVLDRLGEHAKANVILDLERVRVYNSEADYLDATKVFGALSDLFGTEVSAMFVESTLLEMDRIKTVAESD